MNHPTIRQQRGHTLVECVAVLGIVGVVVGTVMPDAKASIDRRRLEAVTAQIETELQLARSAAVSSNQTVRVAFSESTAGTCYIVYAGSPGGCSCGEAGGATFCSADATPLHRNDFLAADRVQVASNSASVGFDPVHGTVTPTATIRVTGRAGEQVRLIVNVMGRLRTCAASPGLPAYKPC